MSSASTGQLDSFLSFKSTPEVEVDSLQLNKEHVLSDRSLSPKVKSESPTLGGLFDSKITTNLIDDKLEEQMKSNPDETIQHDTTHIEKDETEQTTEDVEVGSSKNEEKLQLPMKSLPVPESHQDDTSKPEHEDTSKVSAYARLEFENFIFYVQTLQVVLGRKSENDHSHSVDVHLGNSKAISRKHAKIFYNFGTERFELSIQGKNGAFVDDAFIERGATVPLTNKSKVQIGQIVFRFVLPGMNPQEKLESPSKPINPADAISLRSSLYHHSPSENVQDKSDSNTPALSSKDFEPVNKTGASASDTAAADATAAQKKSKEKKAPKPPKPPKKVYTLEEIPEEYRTKPNCSYSNLIATCLRTHGTPKGMSLAEIYKSIKELFPFYKYCPDGWQSSVRHNLSLNKAFRKVSKEGKGWLWGLDEEYCAEKERAKKKQAAAAAAKAKAAALKLEQQQLQQQKLQQQRLEQQKQMQQNPTSSISPGLSQSQPQQPPQPQLPKPGQLPNSQSLPTNPSLQNIPLQSPAINQQQQQQQQKLTQLSLQNTKPHSTSGQLQNQPTNEQFKSQTAASTPIQQYQPQPVPNQINQPATPTPSQPKFTTQLQQPLPQLHQQTTSLPVQPNKPQQYVSAPQQPQFQQVSQQNQQFVTQNKPVQPIPSQYQAKTPSIQAQLAANRGVSPQISRPPSQQQQVTPKPPPTGLTADTKKALAHLQQQLVVLSKDLKTLVDRPTISAILTQAIAMTIAQVTQAAKTKGITSDPLATLIETNPQQLTRILTVALNAATFKVTNGRIKAPLSISPSVNNSAANSRAGTPGLPQHSPPPLQPQVSSPAVSKIPIQPIQQQQQPQYQPSSQLQQPHVPLQNNHQYSTNPQPHFNNTINQPPSSSAQFQGNPQNLQQPGSNIVQPQPLKTQSNPLLSHPPVVSVKNGAQTQPATPNASKVQLLQRANSTVGAPGQVGQAYNNSNSQFPSASTPQPSQQQTSFNNSFVSNLQNQVKQPQTEPSTPQLQRTQSIVPRSVQHVQQNRPASQPNADVGLSSVQAPTPIQPLTNISSSTGNNITYPTRPQTQSQLQSQLQSPALAQPQVSSQPQISSQPHVSSQPQSQPQSLSQSQQQYPLRSSQPIEPSKSVPSHPTNIPQNDGQVKPEPIAEPIQPPKPVDAVSEHEADKKVEPSTSNNNNHNQGAPDLSFLDDDLNDEEFDKVLESLSKEGTPVVEGDDKAMDPEELNRLLSSDFTQSAYEPATTNTKTDSRKRSLEDSSISINDESHNDKIARHD